ncbi:hypothetical protein J5N97_019569 [Dioscorea zingiberensis]|uniref:Germin-like protein n=1 Tax=Dioscorea zingiberensis TaxID=325984 RepID=A0A9D5HCT6_9LILI|nr:hypothetical protein J5N97_019569 [Dioscorea zingiberensis]
MASTSIGNLTLMVITITVLMMMGLISVSHSSDPDATEDFCVADLRKSPRSSNSFPCKPTSQVTADDFVYSGLTKEGNITNHFGFFATVGNVNAFPALNTLGLSVNRVDYAPAAVNPPHTHPRATELITVIHGKLLIGMVTSEGELFSKVVEKDEVFVVPRGLLHFQHNVGKGKARTHSVFNSQKPGFISSPFGLFGSVPTIPDEVLAKSFLLDIGVVQEIKAKLNK